MDASERGRNGSGDGFRGGGRELCLGCTEELSGYREDDREWMGGTCLHMENAKMSAMAATMSAPSTALYRMWLAYRKSQIHG